MKRLVQSVAGKLGFRLVRVGLTNRFQAAEECLQHLKARGYRPSVVIDGGANRGQFFRLAHGVFPDAEFHLIEPQPGCAESLQDLASERVAIHAVALTEPGVDRIRMIGGGAEGGSTGAYAALDGEQASDGVDVVATTLDDLLGDRLDEADRALLKLDLESHELAALRGATRLLTHVEIVLVEVRFYDVGRRGIPLIAEISSFLNEAGFMLYDLASLSGRRRDGRLRLGDAVFARRDSALLEDTAWE